MQFTLSGIVAALVLVATAPQDGLLEVTKYSGQVNPGSYIVRLKDGVNKAMLFQDSSLRESVTHHDWTVINGFAGVFDKHTLDKLRGSDLVESIEEDGFMSIQATQTDAPWGLARISHTNPVSGDIKSLNYTYTYGDEFLGAGVDIYVVDTGVNLDHADFGGRAVFGWTGAGLAKTDDHGHGSHVAGIAAGTRYGVAKRANVISVKVLNSSGIGTLANVIGGLNYVREAAADSGRPSIASSSLGGGASKSIDDAATALTDAGVHVVVAAGNANVDAANTSPARCPSVITVGAVDMVDSKASFSNYGSVVNIWAPGVSITSAGYRGTSSTLVQSGTSQATPHVSGLAALYLCEHGNVPPATLAENLWSQADRITGLRSGSNNRLAVGPVLIWTGEHRFSRVYPKGVAF